MKAKSIWRRELAFVLTVVILFSCWVFVAPKIKATYSASAGKYYVKVTCESSNATGGWNSNHHWTINGKSTNGTDGAAQIAYVDHTVDYNGTKTVWEGSTDKFPTYAGYRYNFGGGATNRNLRMKIHIYAGYDSSHLWEVAAHSSEQKGDSGYFSAADGTISLDTPTGNYPKASSMTGLSCNNLTIDSDTATVTPSGPTYVKDQYGVVIASSKCTVSYARDGYKYTNSSGSNCSTTDVSVASSNGKVTANSQYKAQGYNQHYLGIKCSATFNGGTATQTVGTTLTYKALTATWNYYTDNSGASTGSSNSATSTVYFGDTPTARTDLTSSYYDNAKHHSGGTFSTSRMTADATFNMSYSTNTNHTMNQYSQLEGNKVNHQVKCSGCQFKQTVEHTYGGWSDNSNGTCSRTCSICSFVQTETHDWGAWQIIPNPDTENNHTNHEQAAEHFRTCRNCSAKDYDNHTWSVDRYIDATCLTDGHTQYKCNDCQLTILDLNQDDDGEEDLVPALGHDYQYYDEGTKTDETHQKKCSRCNDIIDVPHPSYGDYYDYSSTQHAQDCTVCSHAVKTNHTMTAMQNKIPTGNDFAATNARNTLNAAISAGTFDFASQHFSYCTVCGRVEDYDHDYEGAETTPATCTEKGVTTYTCSACGESYTDANIPANGHTWGDVKSSDATDNSSGFTYFECVNCHEFCPAAYDNTKEEYNPNPGENNENVVESETSVEAKSVELPAPYFNDDSSEAKFYGVDYSTRPAAFKFDTSLDSQTVRFAGSVKVPENVDWDISSSSKNVIKDFGFVYTQTKYICDYNAGTGKYIDGSNPNPSKLRYVPSNLSAKGELGYKIYQMSVFDNSGEVDHIKNGFSHQKVGSNTHYLTFNLVIGVNVSNWAKEYAAIPYITYTYNGIDYTVYDGGASNNNDGSKYSHRSVTDLAEDIMYFDPFEETFAASMKYDYGMTYNDYHALLQNYKADKAYVLKRYFEDRMDPDDFDALVDAKINDDPWWTLAIDIEDLLDNPDYYDVNWYNGL